MKIVQGMGLALALAIGTAGCVQTADADTPASPTVPNLGLPLPGETTTTVAPTPYVAADARFSAVFPDDAPERVAQVVPVLGYEVPLTMYSVIERDWAVSVAFFDYAAVTASAEVTPAALDSALDGAARNTGGTVVSRAPVDLVGAIGVDGVIETPEATVLTRIIGVGGGAWMIQVVTARGDAPPAAYQTLLETFQVL